MASGCGRFASRRLRGSRRLVPGNRGQARGEVKHASGTTVAFDPDFPAHHFDQLRGDGQAQSGAAEFTPGGGVDLRKRLKDPALLIGGDADSRIDDAEMQLFEILRRNSYFQIHFAAGRKLDGIADQYFENTL